MKIIRNFSLKCKLSWIWWSKNETRKTKHIQFKERKEKKEEIKRRGYKKLFPGARFGRRKGKIFNEIYCIHKDLKSFIEIPVKHEM